MKNSIHEILQTVRFPNAKSHKGQNGRVLVIGGSHLFHSASLWALTVASRIVDLVHYASIEENNRIVQKRKEEFRNGIVIHREEIEEYIEEDDCILIGPGMLRSERAEIRSGSDRDEIRNLDDLELIKDEGEQTFYLTQYLLKKYPQKKWVIDAGALQMLEPEWIPNDAILTPHHREFEMLKLKTQNPKIKGNTQNVELFDEVKLFAKKYKCTVLHKGKEDIVASSDQELIIPGGNAGMTKGGTGDVLAGLVSGLAAMNDSFTAAVTASYINKKAGEELFKSKGFWFNASDLAEQIPQTMKKIFIP
jgi:hydroxyethylthiazole kinase-like uncharacterized protein yjeF